MRGHSSPPAGGNEPGSRRALWGKIGRYAAGSVVATVCSEAAFLLLYGGLGAAPAVASTIGWLAGALPNYWLNRTWTWRRRGRPSLTLEVLPYVAIVLGTLLVAAVATSSVDAALTSGQISAEVRIALVSGTFVAVYGLIFLLRFFLLDRLFRRAQAGSPPGNVGPVSTKEKV